MNLKAAFKKADLRRLNDKLRKMDVDMRKESTKQLVKAAMAIRNDAVRSVMGPPKTGEIYGKHQASAPGESPATDTGNLAGSINVTSDKDRVMATVVVSANYAMALEFGTRNMEERPFMRPAIENNKHLLPSGIKDAFSVAKPKKG